MPSASARSTNCANSLGMQPAPITLWPWPGATRWRPSSRTACPGPVFALKVLCRSWTSIMSGLPAVVAGEGRCRAEAVEATGIDAVGIGALDELREQLGHAAGADHVVALAGRDQVAP